MSPDDATLSQTELRPPPDLSPRSLFRQGRGGRWKGGRGKRGREGGGREGGRGGWNREEREGGRVEGGRERGEGKGGGKGTPRKGREGRIFMAKEVLIRE